MTELHASLCPPLPFSLALSHSLTHTQTDTHIWSPLQESTVMTLMSQLFQEALDLNAFIK